MGDAPRGDAELPERQARLLEELAALVDAGLDAAPEGASAAPAGGLDGAATGEQQLCHRWQQLRAQRRKRADAGTEQCWRWIERLHMMCAAACLEFERSLQHLSELDRQQQEVSLKTTGLRRMCEARASDQERLSGLVEGISERLAVFDSTASVAASLDQGSALASHSEFGILLDRMEEAAAYIEAHYDFSSAKECFHHFEHQRHRACILLRTAVQRSLDRAAAQVELWMQDPEYSSLL